MPRRAFTAFLLLFTVLLYGAAVENVPPDDWAFRELRRPPVSSPATPSTNPIDSFVRSKLAEGTLPPAADKRTLLRRLYFDLIGLPPTPEETRAFLADDSPQAYERVVDRLLA